MVNKLEMEIQDFESEGYISSQRSLFKNIDHQIIPNYNIQQNEEVYEDPEQLEKNKKLEGLNKL